VRVENDASDEVGSHPSDATYRLAFPTTFRIGFMITGKPAAQRIRTNTDCNALWCWYARVSSELCLVVETRCREAL
jgi:hypothetical protein